MSVDTYVINIISDIAVSIYLWRLWINIIKDTQNDKHHNKIKWDFMSVRATLVLLEGSDKEYGM